MRECEKIVRYPTNCLLTVDGTLQYITLPQIVSIALQKFKAPERKHDHTETASSDPQRLLIPTVPKHVAL